MKRTMKETLAEIYEEAITVEKELCAIVFIIEDEPLKDSKGMVKRSQTSISKAKEK